MSRLLQSARVRLAPLSQQDTPTLARWQQDPDYLRLLAAEPAFPKSESQLSEWIRDRQRDANAFLFGIRILADDELIGFIELADILWTHGVAWLAIGIGDSHYWGLGYGGEAMGLALDFAFQELNLFRVQLTVFSYNERAITLYERLGFRREGCYREFMQRDGQRYDMYLYGLLRREWLKS